MNSYKVQEQGNYKNWKTKGRSMWLMTNRCNTPTVWVLTNNGSLITGGL